jgi:SPP1 family phage portal protein
MFGRDIIYSSETEITRDNVLDALRDAFPVHQKNSSQIDYLYRYYKGNQPVLYRQKMVRPEINNRIVENHALEIVDFKKGYVFGEPIQYVRRGDGEDVSKKIAQLNEYMFAEDKAAQDKELAEWFYICGTSYRMVLPGVPGNPPFELDVLDPRYTFVVYNNGFKKRPLMGVKYIRTNDGENLFSIYTPFEYFEIKDDVVIQRPHALGDIPIIEYPANTMRLGAFEVVLGLLDALNNTASNRMDGIEQFIQAFMKFVNCDIDETTFTALKELGALKIKSDSNNPADVDIVSSELDQSQAQITKDDLYQMILIICGMPDRNGANRTTGDTGQAVILRDGWSAAESRARDTELMFKGAEKQFLRLVLRIVKDMEGLELSLGDIDIKFTRNKTDNLLVKTQGLQNMLEAGIHPQIAIANSGLFSDPEQTYLDSMPYLEKWLTKPAEITPGNNKANPENNGGTQ